ncbi:uncharacterized protein ColSpa_10012 [Colletotrichum spaethianum]|uniref:Uncharacterized protein n=1 Tax=Colletotrichum spaethianum TaxID=700344 RepID=A0AA37UKD0_9PEZI|nr:uncharacterized protein ColSpa_10012 [Colletotrichum spaethianum]GKT49831.1 hypothetical protein ColSpa_10012 [Colletotrichum spaethianum]
MSSNGFTPYTVPYTGVVGTVNFVPGAAAHPPAPQDKDGQGGFQRPAVADEPVAADTSRSKGKSMTMGATGGPPEDVIPARFASAGAAAASGGIAIVPGGSRAGTMPSSSEICAASVNGQISVQKKEELKGFNLNKNHSPFGIDGQCDYGGEPSSPTLMTMSAQRRADRALPVLAQQLEAVKAENQRLRDSNHCLQSSMSGTETLRQLLLSLQNNNQQLQTQIQSLYMQMQSIQQQAQNFARHRDNLQARLHNADLSLEELTDLIVRLQSVVRRIDPDIFVTFPVEVQETLTAIHEEWKYQEYCKIFQPQQGNNSSGDVSIPQPQDADQSQSISSISGSSHANVSSTDSGEISSNNHGHGALETGTVSAAHSNSDSANVSDNTSNDISNNDLLSQLFEGLTLGGLNIMSSNQTSKGAQATENMLELYASSTPSSIGTPRTVYSPSIPETAQHTQATRVSQISQSAQAARSVPGAESPETTQDMPTPNTVDSHGTRDTLEH